MEELLQENKKATLCHKKTQSSGHVEVATLFEQMILLVKPTHWSTRNIYNG